MHFDLDLTNADCFVEGRLYVYPPRTWTVELKRLKQWRGESAQLDQEGRFRFSLTVLGAYGMAVTADLGSGGEQKFEQVLDIDRGTNRWELSLSTGTLEGAGPPNATLEHAWKHSGGTKCTTRFQADAQGRIRIEGIPAGRGTVRVLEPKPGKSQDIDLPAGGVIQLAVD